MQLEVIIPKILYTNSFFNVNFRFISQLQHFKPIFFDFVSLLKKSFAFSFMLSESCDKMYEIVIWHPSTQQTQSMMKKVNILSGRN